MRIKREKIYILVAVLALLFFFEGFSRLVLSNDYIFNKIASFDDSSFRLKWIKKHQDSKGIYYEFDIYDPTKGWISRPGLRDKDVFDGKTLNTNSKGLRGEAEHMYGKHPDKLRILIVGDSYTFGDDVSDNETYPYYLQQMFPHAEVINMGVHGYGHDQMLIFLKEEGIKYKPDIIVLGFVYLDIYRNNLKFRDYAKPKFDMSGGKLTLDNAPVPTPEELLEREWVRPKLYDLYNIFRNWVLYNRYSVRYGIFQKKREGLKQDLTYGLLDEMVSLSNSINVKPIFVYLPLKKEVIDSEDITGGESYFFNYCKTNEDLDCVSVLPSFVKQNDLDEKYSPSKHYSPSGNLLVAEEIRDFLSREESL